MRIKVRIIVLLFVLSWGASSRTIQPGLLAQSNATLEGEKERDIGLIPMDSLPNLALDGRFTSRMRTTSRKRTYRIDDLVSIDVAVYNHSAQPFYLFDLKKGSRINVRDEQGRLVAVSLFGTVFPDISAKDYHLLRPGNLDFAHTLLTIGCSPKTRLDGEDKEFVNRGRGCIDIRKPGKYFVSSFSTNNLVVKSENVRTLVGDLQSDTFEIHVGL